MSVLIINAYVYRNRERSFLPMDILCRGGKIAALGERGSLADDGAQVFDACGMAVLPGLIDVHTHGRSGADFSKCSDGELHRMCRDYASHGVTAVMPTIASAPLEDMAGAARQMSDFVSDECAAALCGVHLEGRYLESKKRGAHAEELLAPLCAEELRLFEGVKPVHISAAYELDGDGSFAARALEMGATLGLAHTCATYGQAKSAEERGVTSYTHLFNAMPPLHHREGGAVAACLTGDAYAELICDGIHVSPETVRLAYRCKGERLVLISDSMEATGCEDGEYSIAGEPVTVRDGKALTHSGALAGSTLTLDKALQNLMDFCGIPLSEAIICATEAPAREIGVFGGRGSVDEGKSADLLFADMDEKNFNIRKIMLRGNFI